MTSVERSALVRANAARVYALVNDVRAYPLRFGWCDSARVLDEGDDFMVARLEVRVGGLRTTFTTRNVLEPHRRIGLSLVDGPFRRFSGEWLFLPLSDDASKVSLRLDFDVAGRLVGNALASGFKGWADRMVDDFVREARRGDDGPG
jgi:ribosome-associated toxin RatA of RatAB toxin-antitoxin module